MYCEYTFIVILQKLLKPGRLTCDRAKEVCGSSISGIIRIRRVQDDKSDTGTVKGIVQGHGKCRMVLIGRSSRCTFIARETLFRTNCVVFFVRFSLL